MHNSIRHFWREGGAIKVTIALLLLVLLSTAGYVYRGEALSAYESVAYALDPSAERAYEYGRRHFDARDSVHYDIQTAEHYFHKALLKDAKLPFVQHQLARIAFLRSNFTEAIARINLEIERNPNRSSYYMRGLIEGFMGDYESAVQDYKKYLESDPLNWAATNDLAWVLLKTERYEDALQAIDVVLSTSARNPWLQNSRATALFELGRFGEARTAAQLAASQMSEVSERVWLHAYPGNDPLIASQGIESFRRAIEENLRLIDEELSKQTATPR